MFNALVASMNSANKSAGARGCWWYLTGHADSSLEETPAAYSQEGN